MTRRVTIVRDPSVDYPASGPFSPPEPYPEYPFRNAGRAGLSPGNRIYPLVRRLLRESGADAERFGSPAWNPLGEHIAKGQRVFVLTNFVKDARPDEKPEQFASKCTHASVVRAVLDYAAIAAGDPKLVSFGNAPIQSCDHVRVSEQTGASSVRAFYAAQGHADVGPHDLRLTTAKFRFGAIYDKRHLNAGDGVRVDLAEQSLLEAHYAAARSVEFRVGDYPPAETMSFHGLGRHIYVVNRRALEADVIVSVPKLKTHERVGITCAIKGTVGAIGMKECLAHHRLGGADRGGDEYPRTNLLRTVASAVADRASAGGTDPIANGFRIASKVLYRALRVGPSAHMLGMWHGNDTCWRMSVDIARLIRFARRDGSLAPSPVRRHLALVDGIVGGEGSGPLNSTPHRSGALLFGADVALVDAACAFVMGFDPARVPLVTGAFGIPTYPLTDATLDALDIVLNGEAIDGVALAAAFAPRYRASKGFLGHIELTPGKRVA